jgi:hypothetical protein
MTTTLQRLELMFTRYYLARTKRVRNRPPLIWFFTWWVFVIICYLQKMEKHSESAIAIFLERVMVTNALLSFPLFLLLFILF